MSTITDTNTEVRGVLADPAIYTLGLLEAAEILGISRTKAYALAKSGELVAGVPVIRAGGRYAVSTAHLRRVLGLD